MMRLGDSKNIWVYRYFKQNTLSITLEMAEKYRYGEGIINSPTSERVSEEERAEDVNT